MFRLHVYNGLCSTFNRIRNQLPTCQFQRIQQFNTQVQKPLLFHATQTLSAEPLKKKKTIDPMVQRMRDERRRKRIEKAIRLLERHEKQFKPIDEMEVERKIVQEKVVRTRVSPKLSADEIEGRRLLKREWSDYKRQVFLSEMDRARIMIESQAKALAQLRLESEDLYQEAIKLDPTLIPYTAKGPVDTPPIPGYDSPDGVYIDVTRKWD